MAIAASKMSSTSKGSQNGAMGVQVGVGLVAGLIVICVLAL